MGRGRIKMKRVGWKCGGRTTKDQEKGMEVEVVDRETKISVIR